jgi:hypothetical protein
VAGAIVIVGSEVSEMESGASASNSAEVRIRQGSLACVEVLGRSVLGRTVEDLVRAGMDFISVFANKCFASAVIGEENVEFDSGDDVWRDVTRKLWSYKEKGDDAVLITRLGAYVELDPTELIQFHRATGEPVTRAWDENGVLDVWVISPERVADIEGLFNLLQTTRAAGYPVRGYVNRLESPRDVRRLICDGLASRCQFRPAGFEVRPGVWMGQGAQVEKGARIVAPAFIGRGAKIADQCLITRGSNVESHSHVDYGTVVEDSSVLSNTYVGIGLDLAHSIVDGNSLLNLEHQVMLRIADPVVLRQVQEKRERVETEGRMLASLDFGEMVISPKAEEKK